MTYKEEIAEFKEQFEKKYRLKLYISLDERLKHHPEFKILKPLRNYLNSRITAKTVGRFLKKRIEPCITANCRFKEIITLKQIFIKLAMDYGFSEVAVAKHLRLERSTVNSAKNRAKYYYINDPYFKKTFDIVHDNFISTLDEKLANKATD